MVFEPGLLNSQSDAKERRFVNKSNVLFAGLFVVPIILAIVQFSGLWGH